MGWVPPVAHLDGAAVVDETHPDLAFQVALEVDDAVDVEPVELPAEAHGEIFAGGVKG